MQIFTQSYNFFGNPANQRFQTEKQEEILDRKTGKLKIFHPGAAKRRNKDSRGAIFRARPGWLPGGGKDRSTGGASQRGLPLRKAGEQEAGRWLQLAIRARPRYIAPLLRGERKRARPDGRALCGVLEAEAAEIPCRRPDEMQNAECVMQNAGGSAGITVW